MEYIDNLRINTLTEVKTYYKPAVNLQELPLITNSNNAYEILLSIWDHDYISYLEQAYILLLNNANRVIAYRLLSTGIVTATFVDPRPIFQAALLTNASGIIIAHNHPSGRLTPSDPDIKITEQINAGAKILNIQLLDHLIISPNGYKSMRDEGYF